MARGIILLALFVRCAFAEAPAPLSIERLTREAALVVQGQVANKSVFRDGSGRIVTEVKVRVSEVWKGEWAESTLPLLHSGGILGEQAARVIGQAQYTPGEEVILFLTPVPGGKFVTIGMSWGKFEVRETSTGAKQAVQSGVESPTPISISELKKQIQHSSAHD